MGLRTSKTVTQNGTSITTRSVWADKKLLGTKTGDEAVRLLYQGDSPIGFVANNADVYLYVKNLQGDVTGIADKTGTLVVSYTYDAWGNILSQSGDAAIAKLNPITYRGYNYDTETGLYYLQSRYYNSDWGRFLNADGNLGSFTGINGNQLFSYCKNNPVNFVDYNGQMPAVLAALGAALLGLGLAAIEVVLGMIIFIGLIAIVMSPEFQNAVGELVDEIERSIQRDPLLMLPYILVNTFLVWLEYMDEENVQKKSDKDFLDDCKNRPEPRPPADGGKGTPTKDGGSETLIKNREEYKLHVEIPKTRKGNVHLHLKNDSNKYYYNVKKGYFVKNDYNGPKAPRRVQKYLNNKDIIRGIRKGLERIGY